MKGPESRDSSCLAQGPQKPQLFLKEICRTLSSCFLVLTETAKATGPAKLQMSVS